MWFKHRSIFLVLFIDCSFDRLECTLDGADGGFSASKSKFSPDKFGLWWISFARSTFSKSCLRGKFFLALALKRVWYIGLYAEWIRCPALKYLSNLIVQIQLCKSKISFVIDLFWGLLCCYLDLNCFCLVSVYLFFCRLLGLFF